MSDIKIILKLNALSFLLLGALFVFIPETVADFLSDATANDAQFMPRLVLVAMGVVLNVCGMLLIWLSNREVIPSVLLLVVALGDFLWLAATAVLLLMNVWVSSSNGIAVAGLVAMLVGYFGLLQFQYYLKNK